MSALEFIYTWGIFFSVCALTAFLGTYLARHLNKDGKGETVLYVKTKVKDGKLVKDKTYYRD